MKRLACPMCAWASHAYDTADGQPTGAIATEWYRHRDEAHALPKPVIVNADIPFAKMYPTSAPADPTEGEQHG